MPNDEPSRSPRKNTILLVDDEVMVLEVGRAILERLGHEVLTAESGEAALVLFDSHRETIGCVVLDLTMPGIDGKETFRRLRDQAPDLPVVIASGQAAEQLASQFAETEGTAIIQKPYQVADLSATIQAILQP